jgi:hypothetical protein
LTRTPAAARSSAAVLVLQRHACWPRRPTPQAYDLAGDRRKVDDRADPW